LTLISRMPILSKKKAGNKFNNRNAETRRANAEKRMKNQKKATAKGLKMLQSRGPSIGNIQHEKYAAAREPGPRGESYHGGTRRRSRF
jgi:hypothetical protein